MTVLPAAPAVAPSWAAGTAGTAVAGEQTAEYFPAASRVQAREGAELSFTLYTA